jgi:hypothetical protein
MPADAPRPKSVNPPIANPLPDLFLSRRASAAARANGTRFGSWRNRAATESIGSSTRLAKASIWLGVMGAVDGAADNRADTRGSKLPCARAIVGLVMAAAIARVRAGTNEILESTMGGHLQSADQRPFQSLRRNRPSEEYLAGEMLTSVWHFSPRVAVDSSFGFRSHAPLRIVSWVVRRRYGVNPRRASAVGFNACMPAHRWRARILPHGHRRLRFPRHAAPCARCPFAAIPNPARC